MKKDNASFEQNIQRLEEIISRFSTGNLTLDESLALYDEGIKLSAVCRERLEKAEQRLTVIEGGNEKK